jgi:hypothetical protein
MKGEWKMLGVTLIKLTDTDNDTCFINLNKVSMILTASDSDEASIYLDGDKAIVVKIDSNFKQLEFLLEIESDVKLKLPDYV